MAVAESTLEVLTLAETSTLLAARRTLAAAGGRISSEARGLINASDASDRGRLAEALSAADDAVFNALNTASAYCDCANSKGAIESMRPR